MKQIAAILAALTLLQCPVASRAGELEAKDINDFIVKIAKDVAGYLKQAGAAEVAVVPFKSKDDLFELEDALGAKLLADIQRYR